MFIYVDVYVCKFIYIYTYIYIYIYIYVYSHLVVKVRVSSNRRRNMRVVGPPERMVAPPVSESVRRETGHTHNLTIRTTPQMTTLRTTPVT